MRSCCSMELRTSSKLTTFEKSSTDHFDSMWSSRNEAWWYRKTVVSSCSNRRWSARLLVHSIRLPTIFYKLAALKNLGSLIESESWGSGHRDRIVSDSLPSFQVTLLLGANHSGKVPTDCKPNSGGEIYGRMEEILVAILRLQVVDEFITSYVGLEEWYSAEKLFMTAQRHLAKGSFKFLFAPIFEISVKVLGGAYSEDSVNYGPPQRLRSWRGRYSPIQKGVCCCQTTGKK